VLQAALKLVIEPIFEYEFEPKSFGFRQGLGCKDVLRGLFCHSKAGYSGVVDADLHCYFGTMPHAALLAKMGNRITDGRVLELVEQFHNQTIE
jgi:RNA-directed DNA polymerase